MNRKQTHRHVDHDIFHDAPHGNAPGRRPRPETGIITKKKAPSPISVCRRRPTDIGLKQPRRNCEVSVNAGNDPSNAANTRTLRPVVQRPIITLVIVRRQYECDSLWNKSVWLMALFSASCYGGSPPRRFNRALLGAVRAARTYVGDDGRYPAVTTCTIGGIVRRPLGNHFENVATANSTTRRRLVEVSQMVTRAGHDSAPHSSLVMARRAVILNLACPCLKSSRVILRDSSQIHAVLETLLYG